MLLDISPHDKYQFFKSQPHARLNKSWQIYHEIYATLAEYCQELMVTREVSKNGRIHYHANLILDQPYLFSLTLGSIKDKFMGMYDYDTIQDIAYRMKYITKDKGIDGNILLHINNTQVNEV